MKLFTEMLLISGNFGGPQCPVCGGVMVTLEQGPMLCGVAIERLNRWLESGAVHHSDLAGLRHMICLYSLLNRLQNNSSA